MEFFRHEYWSGLPFPSGIFLPGDLPNPGIEPGSPALQADALPSEPQERINVGVCVYIYIYIYIYICICHASVCASVLCLVTTKIWSEGPLGGSQLSEDRPCYSS